MLKNDLKKNGGFSYNVKKNVPTKKDGRYMVGFEELETFSRIEYMKDDEIYFNLLQEVQWENMSKKLFLGGWVDTEDNDRIWLDISECINDKDEALAIAWSRDEKAIYDIVTYTSMTVENEYLLSLLEKQLKNECTKKDIERIQEILNRLG
jgi:hypothetical protein